MPRQPQPLDECPRLGLGIGTEAFIIDMHHAAGAQLIPQRHHAGVEPVVAHDIVEGIDEAKAPGAKVMLVIGPAHRARIAVNVQDARLRKRRADERNESKVERHLVGDPWPAPAQRRDGGKIARGEGLKRLR